MRKLLLTVSAMLFLLVTAISQRTITGKVTSKDGTSLQGVTVEGSDKSTTLTADDGSFSIKVTSSARYLLFTLTEYSSEQVSIGNKTTINVSLSSSIAKLQEVVVVGYGTQKRSEVSSSISKIDPTPIAQLVTPSVDKQLGGRAAGVQVTNPSGLVNQPPRIRIRGVNSISGGRSPLFILDGVNVSSGGFSGVTNDNLLGDINPNDIESVDVLKDGAATAIYGSRASNGVIIITTKKGRSGIPKVNYNVTWGFAKPSKKFSLLSGDDFVTIANEKLMAAPGGTAQAFNPNHINTDWQDVIFRPTAHSATHNLSIEGSNDRVNYFISAGYSNQEGIIVTNANRRYSLRGNIDVRINKWLKLSNYITLSRSEDADQNNGGNSLSGAVYNAIRALPDVSPYDTANIKFSGYNITSDGKALGMGNNTKLIDNNNTNIAYVLNKNIFRSIKHRILDNVGAEIKPFSWLTYTSKASIDFITLNDFQSYDPLHGDGQSVNGLVFNQAANTLNWDVQNYLIFNKKFRQHNIAATVGTEYIDGTSNSFYAQGQGLADPFFGQQNIISNGFSTQFSGGSFSQGSSLLSYFGRVNYDYGGKYYLQASFRRDGLSKFAIGNKWANFPGASVAYRISQEDFWKGSSISKVLSDVKLRGSFAKVGNNAIAGGNFGYENLYGLSPYGSISGIAASQIGNSNLTWETANKYDVGADFGFLKNRINLVVDYFVDQNNNLVLQAPLPSSLGVPGNNILRNIGAMKNNGIELSLNATILSKKDFSWDIGINYTHQNNVVTSLYLGKDINVVAGSGATYAIDRVGLPLNSLYGYVWAGVNPLNGNPMYLKADGTKIQGDIASTKYYTVNADGSLGTQTTLAGSDQQVLGNSLVKYFGGITSTINYMGFSLDVLFRYAGGNKIMNITAQESLFNQGFTNSGTVLLDRWTKPGQITDVPRVWYGRDNFINNTNSSLTRFIEDGDYIRLDNLQLMYTIPVPSLQKWSKNNVKSFRVYVQGQNLWTKTKYKGLDPDNIGEQGADYNTVPSARTWSFGLNVGF